MIYRRYVLNETPDPNPNPNDPTTTIDEEILSLLNPKDRSNSYFKPLENISEADTDDISYNPETDPYRGRLVYNDRLSSDVQGRIFWIRKPQELSYPCVVLTWSSGANRVMAMGRDPGESDRMLQVSVFVSAGSTSNQGYLKTIEIMENIRLLLERFPLGEVDASGNTLYKGNIDAIMYENEFTQYQKNLKVFNGVMEFKVHSYERPSIARVSVPSIPFVPSTKYVGDGRRGCSWVYFHEGVDSIAPARIQ